VHELSYEEVAEALDLPIGTVKSNVHRGLKLLRGENHDRIDN
jgi:DNA-directed RNA polymerase specialized sigma24 family protein